MDQLARAQLPRHCAGHRFLRRGAAVDRRHDQGHHRARQSSGGAPERRRILPRAPAIDRGGQGDDPLRDLRLVVRRHLRHRGRGLRAAGAGGDRSADHDRRSRLHEDEPEAARADAGRRLQGGPLPPHPARGFRAAQQAHPPQARHLRRPGGLRLRSRRLAAVDGPRPGQGALARHRRAAPGTDRQRRAVSLRPALGGGDAGGADGGAVLPSSRAGGEDPGPRARGRAPGRHLGPGVDVQDGHRLVTPGAASSRILISSPIWRPSSC